MLEELLRESCRRPLRVSPEGLQFVRQRMSTRMFLNKQGVVRDYAAEQERG
jgi:hypothetical protein